jgi:hypothetical protein
MKSMIACAVVTAGIAASAGATVTVYTDRGAWLAAAGGSTGFEDFNSTALQTFADGQTLNFASGLSITRDGSPNGADGDLAISAGTQFGNIDGTTHLDGETGADPHEIVNLNFGTAVFAFGADFSSPFSGDGIGLQIGNDLVLVDTISGFDVGFFGIVSNGAVSDIQIVGNPATDTFQELWQADNFEWTAIPTPGAATMLGLAGLAAARRRR